MSGQDSSATTIGEYDTTSRYRDDDSLEDDPGVTGTESLSSKSRASTWTGSPYEPLPSEPGTSYSASTFGDYDDGLAISRPTTFTPTATDAEEVESPTTGRRTKSRAIAGLVSAVLGLAAGGRRPVPDRRVRLPDLRRDAQCSAAGPHLGHRLDLHRAPR